MTADKTSPLTLSPADRSQQSRIRLPLPLVLGNANYRKRKAELQRMDEILAVSVLSLRYPRRCAGASQEHTATHGVGGPGGGSHPAESAAARKCDQGR